MAILKNFGASASVTEEILVYNSDVFNHQALGSVPHFPLADEKFVTEWEGYVCELNSGAYFESLADRLVQLSFPIQSQISGTAEYTAATRRGADTRGMLSATGIRLKRPHDIRVLIHSTWAGRIPVMIVPCREDFVSLVRAFSARNEPAPIPESMGACMISGYNNWMRLRRFREEWQRTHDQSIPLREIDHHKESYQDRFLILSDGRYSGVPAERMGIPENDWLNLSLIIRREHECAHYWTRRVLGSMRNYLIDEIIADYCGMLAAMGRFQADWMLAFLGLDLYPQVREQGRVHNYRGSPVLGEDAFAIVQKLVVAAAMNLERFHEMNKHVIEAAQGSLLVLLTLTSFTLEELASEQGKQLFSTELQRKSRNLPQFRLREPGPYREDGYAKSASDAGRSGRS